MQPDVNDVIAMLKVQRNANADDCAMLKAMCDGYERKAAEDAKTIAMQAERIAELEKAAPEKPRQDDPI